MTDPPHDPAGVPVPRSGDAAAGAEGRDRPAAELPDEEIVAARRLQQELGLRERTERLAAEMGAVVKRLAEALVQIERAGEQHAALASAVSENIGPAVVELQEVVNEELGRLRAEVDALLAERDQQKSSRNSPIDWAQLDAGHAAVQWPVLARWIGEVLVPLYDLTRDELPDCWALHRPVVAELSWLQTAHLAAYQARATPQAAADWHTRWLPAVLARIREVIRTDECHPGQHTPRRGQVIRMEKPGDSGAARRQVATPRYWWSFYELAYREDLAARQARIGTDGRDWTPARAEPTTA